MKDEDEHRLKISPAFRVFEQEIKEDVFLSQGQLSIVIHTFWRKEMLFGKIGVNNHDVSRLGLDMKNCTNTKS